MRGGTNRFPKTVSALPATFSPRPFSFASSSLKPEGDESKRDYNKTEPAEYKETPRIRSSRLASFVQHNIDKCCIANDARLRRSFHTNIRNHDNSCKSVD